MINQKNEQKTRNIKYLLKQIALKMDIDCFLLYVFFQNLIAKEKSFLKDLI